MKATFVSGTLGRTNTAQSASARPRVCPRPGFSARRLSHLFLPKRDTAAHELLNDTSIEYAARVLATLYKNQRRSAAADERMSERVELLIRLLWTFVLAKGELATSEAKLRATLQRWIAPMIA
jgi:hypothetical protein